MSKGMIISNEMSKTMVMAASMAASDGVKMEVSGACHNYVTASGLTLAATSEKEWKVVDELRALSGLDKGLTLARAIVLYRAKRLELDKAVSKRTADGDVKSVKMSMASFAETFCGIKGASANIYVNTVEAFYNVTDEAFELKDERYSGIAFSVLSLLLGVVNDKCGGDVTEFYTDFCEGDDAVLRLHGRSQAEVKKQLSGLRGKSEDVDKAGDKSEDVDKAGDKPEDKPEVPVKKRVIQYVAQALTLTDDERVAAVVNTAIEQLNAIDF